MVKQVPTVSVAIITYNQEGYIRAALDGILCQKTEFSVEVVIGDDSSSDATVSIINDYESRFPGGFNLISRKSNVGITANLIDVFRHCNGKYIAILEGDDYWTDPYKLQEQVNLLEAHKEFAGVAHRVSIMENGQVIGFVPKEGSVISQFGLKNFLAEEYFATQSLVFRNVFSPILPENIKMTKLLTTNRFIADFALCCIVLNMGMVGYIDRSMSVYRFLRKTGQSNYNSMRKSIEVCKDHLEVLQSADLFLDYRYSDEISKLKNKYAFTLLNHYLKTKMLIKFIWYYINDLSLKSKIDYLRYIFEKIK